MQARTCTILESARLPPSPAPGITRVRGTKGQLSTAGVCLYLVGDPCEHAVPPARAHSIGSTCPPIPAHRPPGLERSAAVVERTQEQAARAHRERGGPGGWEESPKRAWFVFPSPGPAQGDKPAVRQKHLHTDLGILLKLGKPGWW